MALTCLYLLILPVVFSPGPGARTIAEYLGVNCGTPVSGLLSDIVFDVNVLPVFLRLDSSLSCGWESSNEEYRQPAFGPSCALLALECRGVWQEAFGVSLVGMYHPAD